MIVNFIVFAAGVVVLYKYHKSEVESGKQGLPGLQPLLQYVDANYGSKLAPVPRLLASTPAYIDVRPENLTVAKEPVAVVKETNALVPSVFAQSGQSAPSSDNPQPNVPSSGSNSGEKVENQAPGAWVPQSGTPKFSANKDLYSERDKNKFLDTMAAVANSANPMAPMDHSLYPTYRPLLIKPDEKTAQSLSDKSEDKFSEKEDRKDEKSTEKGAKKKDKKKKEEKRKKDKKKTKAKTDKDS